MFNDPKVKIGLDVGTTYVKLVKLKCRRKRIELADYRVEPSDADLGKTLKNVAGWLDKKTVNTSVSGTSTVIRYALFPKMSRDEFSKSLTFEIQKHIPFPMEEVYSDNFILKDDLPDNKMLVLLAAVKKDFLNQRLALFNEAGIKVNAVDIDSLAIINGFNFNHPAGALKDKAQDIKNKTIAILNIGAAESNLSILESGIPYLSRDIHFAGNNLTQSIMEKAGVDLNTAEQMKVNPEKESLEKIKPAIESALNNLASEIRTSFDYYESQNASSATKIFISGGGGSFPGIKEMLGVLLNIEIEQWDPFKQIKIPASIDQQRLKSLSGQLAVAAGLAIR